MCGCCPTGITLIQSYVDMEAEPPQGNIKSKFTLANMYARGRELHSDGVVYY